MIKSKFVSANVNYEYEFNDKAKSSLEQVAEIRVDGKLFTRKNCEEKYNYTWRTSAGGVVLYFADEKGELFSVEREWLRKNAGRNDDVSYVKNLRILSGMTQKEFSEYFHIPKRSIEDWECERRKAPEYVIELIEYKLQAEGIIPKKEEQD